MSPALLNSSVFFDPNDLNDIDAVLHYDDDPVHSTHVCMNCRRIESPDNVRRVLTLPRTHIFSCVP